MNENVFLPQEQKMIDELVNKFGMNETLAIDCLASRTLGEMATVLTFLRRYGDKLNIK